MRGGRVLSRTGLDVTSCSLGGGDKKGDSTRGTTARLRHFHGFRDAAKVQLAGSLVTSANGTDDGGHMSTSDERMPTTAEQTPVRARVFRHPHSGVVHHYHREEAFDICSISTAGMGSSARVLYSRGYVRVRVYHPPAEICALR